MRAVAPKLLAVCGVRYGLDVDVDALAFRYDGRVESGRASILNRGSRLVTARYQRLAISRVRQPRRVLRHGSTCSDTGTSCGGKGREGGCSGAAPVVREAVWKAGALFSRRSRKLSEDLSVSLLETYAKIVM